MRVPETRVNRELLLEFFLVFARFEYALKATRFFVRHPEDPRRPPTAEPDWDSLVVSLDNTLDPARTDLLREACEYIGQYPPNKQVVVNGAVAWETPIYPPEESQIHFLLRMVRCVRNNLFHGGKHNIDVHESTERTERLLRSSLIILEECLALAPEQARAFHEAVL